jgi:hypothetical protein
MEASENHGRGHLESEQPADTDRAQAEAKQLQACGGAAEPDDRLVGHPKPPRPVQANTQQPICCPGNEHEICEKTERIRQ